MTCDLCFVPAAVEQPVACLQRLFKLPLLVSFLTRPVSFLSRCVSFLSRQVSFLMRITEAFSLEYIIHKTLKWLKTVGFHTDDFNRLVTQLHVYSLITYSDLNQQCTDRFMIQLYGEFNWKYGQIRLLWSLWFSNFIQ